MAEFKFFRKIHEFQDNDEKVTNSQVIYLERVSYGVGKLALFVVITLFSERTYGLFKDYLDYTTYFETRYVSQFYAQMPALTICPLFGYKVPVLKVRS